MLIDPLSIRKIGQYPVRRFIAQGGMAWVFEVQDPRFAGQDVIRACKMLKPEAAQGEEFIRFRNEAGLLAGIDHPNLVTIFDFGQDEDTRCFYYVMTYVDGPTMGDYILEYQRLETAAIGPIFLELLQALAELHDRGIVHRDIKPANILIGSDGRARLSDLGIARSESSELETKTNIALGTIMFMSPEQARGKRVGPASDVFAVGLTLFYALTGTYIYDQVDGIDSTSHLDVLGYLNSLQFTGGTIEFDFDPAYAIPPAVQAVIKKAVRYKPEDRYADAREMYAALHDAIYGDVTGEFAIPQIEGPRTTPTLYAGIGAALLAIIGLGVYYLMLKPMWQEEAVLELKAEIRPLRLEVPATLQRLQEIEGAASEELTQAVNAEINSGQTAWEYALEDIDGEIWTSATANLRRAEKSYFDACEILEASNVKLRASETMAALNAEHAALGELYSELEKVAGGITSETIQRSWAELGENVAALDSEAGTGACASVVHDLDQIEGAGATRQLFTSLEKNLALVAPTIAAKAREAADQARTLAEADRVPAKEYASELARGDKLLETGDELLATEPLRARDVFNEATAAFTSAASVVPAVRARANLRDIETEIPRDGSVDLTEAKALIAKGASQFSSRAWAAAAESYNEAARLIAAKLGSERLEKEADGRRAEAREYRNLAKKDNADTISASAGVFADAERQLATADAAFEAEDYQIAAERFDEAAALYRDARTRASTALQQTRDLKSDAEARVVARLPGGNCSVLESISARTDCDEALNAMTEAGQALDALRLEEASRLFAKASTAIIQATDSETGYQDSKPQPPKLEAKFPRKDEVEVLRGTPQRLEVTVSDPNEDDVLSYAWRFNGEPVPGVNSKTFEFTPRTRGDVSVIVSDKTGNQVSAQWAIAIKNRPPQLAVSPAGDIDLARGRPQAFTAQAEDPDGTPTKTEFRLNGKQVATGTSYTFESSKPGKYQLEVISTDEDGGTTSVQRQITIANRNPSLSVTPARDIDLDGGESQRFRATATDPDGAKVAVEYKLDGKTVVRGDAYTFDNPNPGRYILEIVARDQDGATTSTQRGITVRKGNSFPAPTTAEEREVYDTLRDYESALESRNMRDLEVIWRFKNPDAMRDIWTTRFKKYDDIEIRLAITNPPRQNRQGQFVVQWEQQELLNGKGRTWEVTATLLRRSADWQIIDYRRELKRTAGR